MSDLLVQLSRVNNYQQHNLLDLQAVNYREQLLKSPGKYEDPKCLNRFEYEILSQCGEDGIIEEIFRRIGTVSRFFIEFGAGNGLQNNTVSLLLKNWSGLWMETDLANAEVIGKKFAQPLARRQLAFKQTSVTAENVENLFREAEVPVEFDLLSIDIDGNDYWVWKNITAFRPRVVVCEYNARYGPELKWVMRYNPAHRWNGSCYYGASLKSLELLAASKGYCLVGCNLAGVNAFFVREDLANDLFTNPFTSATHFEPQRVFLQRSPIQGNDFGPFESI